MASAIATIMLRFPIHPMPPTLKGFFVAFVVCFFIVTPLCCLQILGDFRPPIAHKIKFSFFVTIFLFLFYCWLVVHYGDAYRVKPPIPGSKRRLDWERLLLEAIENEEREDE